MQGARVYRTLREERALSHNAQSTLITYRHGGFWLVYGDTGTDRTAEALEAFLAELRRLSAEAVPAAEIDDARRSLIGRFALNLELLPQVAVNLAIRRTEGLSADYWDRFPDRVQAVTADDIRRAAAKYLDVSKVQIVAVGDRDQLLPALKPFGPIVFYDAEGRPLTTSSGQRPTPK